MAEYTLKEAAKEMSVSEKTLRRQIKSGKLKAKKVNGPKGVEYRIAGPLPKVSSATGKNSKKSLPGMSIMEAADKMGVSEKTLRRHIKAKKVEANKVKGLKGLEYRIMNLGKSLGEKVTKNLIDSKKVSKLRVQIKKERVEQNKLIQTPVKLKVKETKKEIQAPIKLTKTPIKSEAEETKKEIQVPIKIEKPKIISKLRSNGAKITGKTPFETVYKQMFHDLLARHEDVMHTMGYLQAELQSKHPVLQDALEKFNKRNEELLRMLMERDESFGSLSEEIERLRKEMRGFLLKKVDGMSNEEELFPTFKKWLGMQ